MHMQELAIIAVAMQQAILNEIPTVRSKMSSSMLVLLVIAVRAEILEHNQKLRVHAGPTGQHDIVSVNAPIWSDNGSGDASRKCSTTDGRITS